MKKHTLLIASLLAMPLGLLKADVKLPAIISDHMVLEKTAKVPVWGKADPGEEVTITLNGQTVKATTGADGKWQAVLNLAESGPGPFEMTVQGKNQIKISDVVVGEVWLASGQSNMEWVLKNTIDAEKEIAQSANPLLRQFQVIKATSNEPLEDCTGAWVIASPETSGAFSAVGYYFAKDLQNELKVPVGLVHTSWGGTPSEAWTSAQALDSVPDLKEARGQFETVFKDYPGLKKQWVDGFGAWLKQTGREDKPTADVASFAGTDISPEGWTTLKIPGDVSGAGLPAAGAVWLRKTVDVPAAKANTQLGIELPAIEAFESIYWNGQLVKQLTYQDYPGTGYMRRWGPYAISPSMVKPGKNELAIRLFEPVSAAKFVTAPKVGGMDLSGEWLAKTEYEFPALDAQQTAAPVPPKNPPAPHNTPAYLFNAMINPVVPYAISGVIWYQGESNAGRAWQYRTAFPLLVEDWRAQWKQGDFPFYFCQLANYQEKSSNPGESSWAELREAQTSTLKLPKTGQAILIDLGESKDIHPRNKKDVGQRLAKIALANDYGKKIPFSGPVYESSKIEEGKVRIQFTNTDGGLVAKPVPATYDVRSLSKETAPLVRNSPNSPLEGFAICGEDKKWVWADARIDGDSVIVSSAQVPAPVAVRYAWSENPTCNLYNGAGLPAVPFRTDDFPAATLNTKLIVR